MEYLPYRLGCCRRSIDLGIESCLTYIIYSRRLLPMQRIRVLAGPRRARAACFSSAKEATTSRRRLPNERETKDSFDRAEKTRGSSVYRFDFNFVINFLSTLFGSFMRRRGTARSCAVIGYSCRYLCPRSPIPRASTFHPLLYLSLSFCFFLSGKIRFFQLISSMYVCAHVFTAIRCATIGRVYTQTHELGSHK